MLVETFSVNGVTNEGKFVHAILSISNGTQIWNSWKEVDVAAGAQNPGPFSSIDSVAVGITGDMHVCGITASGRLLHTLLSVRATEWGAFDSPQTIIGADQEQLLQVRIDSAADGLHVCVLIRTSHGQQHILHAVRHSDGTWDPFQDITQGFLSGFPGSFVAVDCAVGTDSTQKLHVCGATVDGRLWHTTLSNQNVWSQFAEVKSAFPQDTAHFPNVEADSANNPGHVSDVRIAGSGDKLHVCVLRSGVLWHTILFSNPVSWQPAFDNVNAEASNPGTILSVDCVGETDHLHVGVITTGDKLWHTIRFEQPDSWVPFEDVTAILGDVAIVLKILSVITFILATFLGSGCPRNVANRINSDCFRISRRDPHSPALRADIQNLLAQFPQCGSPC